MQEDRKICAFIVCQRSRYGVACKKGVNSLLPWFRTVQHSTEEQKTVGQVEKAMTDRHTIPVQNSLDLAVSEDNVLCSEIRVEKCGRRRLKLSLKSIQID